MRNYTSTLYCYDNRIKDINSTDILNLSIDKQQQKLRPLKDVQMKYKVFQKSTEIGLTKEIVKLSNDLKKTLSKYNSQKKNIINENFKRLSKKNFDLSQSSLDLEMNRRQTTSSNDFLYENLLLDSRSKLNKLKSRVNNTYKILKSNLSPRKFAVDSDDFAINEIARVNNPYLNGKTVHLPKIQTEKFLINKTKYDDFNDKMFDELFKYDSLFFD